MSLGICLLGLISLIAGASQVKAEKIRFCGTEWPPFTYAADGKIVSGLSYDIYQEAFRRLEWDVDFDSLPWPRCLKEVEQGSYSGAIDSVSREGMIHGSHPTAFFPLAIFVRPGFPVEAFSWQQLTGKNVGMVNGYHYTEKIRQFRGWKVVLSNGENLMVKMLKAERHDYILLDLFSAPILGSRHQIRLKQLKPLVDSALLYPMFNENFRREMEAMNRVLGVLIQEGYVEERYRKFLGYGYAELLESSISASE